MSVEIWVTIIITIIFGLANIISQLWGVSRQISVAREIANPSQNPPPNNAKLISARTKRRFKVFLPTIFNLFLPLFWFYLIGTSDAPITRFTLIAVAVNTIFLIIALVLFTVAFISESILTSFENDEEKKESL